MIGGTKKKAQDDDFPAAINRMTKVILILTNKQAEIELKVERIQREIEALHKHTGHII